MATQQQSPTFVPPLRESSWRPSAWYHKPGGQWRLGYHTGVDFSADAGTAVYAITDGVITRAGSGVLGQPLGNAIQLAFGNQSAVYAHLQGLAPGISVGTKVRAGQLIGYVGSSGTNSSGPHLHFEIQNQRSGWGQHTDPAPYIAGGYTAEGYQVRQGGAGNGADATYTDDPVEERDRALGDGNLNDGSGGKWLARFLYAKGLRGEDLKTAWAIAMRESRGLNIDSKHKSFNGADYGLFQINKVHAKRIQEKFGWSLDEVGRDPNKAFAVYWWMSNGGKKLGAWNIGSGAYDPGNSSHHTQLFNQWKAKFDNEASAAGISDYSGNSTVGKPARQGQAVDRTDTPSGTGTDTTSATAPKDKLSPEDAADEYGYALSLFKSDPELWSLLQQAIDGDWSASKFQARLQNTRWFREHGDSWRAAEELYHSDPAKYQEELASVERQMLDYATQLGVDIPDDMVKKLAWRAYRYGWDQLKLREELVKFLKPFETGGYAGQAGELEDQLRNLAYNNGVTMNEDFYRKAVESVVGGTRTIEEWEDYIRKQAASLFPVFADQITAGFDVADLASGYLNTMQNVLELGQVGLDDPLIRQALSGFGPDGKPQAMGLWDFEKSLRSDPRWMKTKNAKNQFDSTARTILEQFGFMG